ncbi:MAG: hypothetical protein HC875_27120, partial [Anaerolineales bacterium]|nr:hypothetical protein [Anaerolineales bacterium]
SPRFLFTGILFNYDSLTLLVASLFLWLGVRIARGYNLRWGFWGLGALAGLALLTKYLTALLPLEIMFLAFSRGAGEQRGRGEIEASPRPPLPCSPAQIGTGCPGFCFSDHPLVQLSAGQL